MSLSRQFRTVVCVLAVPQMAAATLVHAEPVEAASGTIAAGEISSDLVRLGHVEWRLRRASAVLCPARAPAAGMTIDYIGAYDAAERARLHGPNGLGDLPQVLSVEPDSPAQRAGIVAGDAITAVDAVPVARIAAQVGDPALLADGVQDAIAVHRPDRPLALRLVRAGRPIDVTLVPEQVCAARIVLKTDGRIDAYTDGTNVAITSGAIRFATDNDELALIAGHEYAHIIARDGEAASLFGRKAQEDNADLNGARLMQCAGYDLSRSLDFWKRYAAFDGRRTATYRSAADRLTLLRKSAPPQSCR